MTKTSRHYKAWDEFLVLGLEILGNNPFTSRVVTKYNNVKKTLIVKVTDDKNIVLTKLTHPSDFEKYENFFLIATKLLSNQQWNDEEDKNAEKKQTSKQKTNKKKNKGKK
ncbi:Signal recognition particle, SRP9/SRP14 subunit [Pseudocohnilembus persalinus]|uniref:Signal recognition particle, SRP9/SRP14 subunit n=1 Tax=Pseudocohnilembus persalinus TaxID=266149 RepID=A0A0V0QR55_PSEPJ|nr:Signal recognition particle, SRP9/SRP14 subunit [Pseudocohnilembus persalinus]|eukprot:KRX04684.1 Signal recognition particle, SRP9/SRP14 subunit [Pseudocohnilembus persalinus]